ncbi:30S ribosomal protein S4 [bacterium]|nr:30S ribosomal protein S4 [bacterium]
MVDAKCKICRRLGEKLFLKGEKCLSPKCPMVRKPYPPGQKGKRRKGGISEYGRELREKQKLKNWYHLKERQFARYVRDALEKRGKVEDAGVQLIQTLERRLDNVVFRLGFATSRSQARQLVSHGHFLVNGKSVNIPSFLVKKGDKIKIDPSSVKKAIFKNLLTTLKKHNVPSWLSLDIKNLEGEVKGLPTFEEAAPPVEVSAIFEFYSR